MYTNEPREQRRKNDFTAKKSKSGLLNDSNCRKMIPKLAILLGCLSLCFGLEYEDNIVKGPSSVGYQSRCGVLHTKHNDYFKNRSIEDSPYDVKHHVLVWQAVVLLICFGAFALLINLIQRIIR